MECSDISVDSLCDDVDVKAEEAGPCESISTAPTCQFKQALVSASKYLQAFGVAKKRPRAGSMPRCPSDYRELSAYVVPTPEFSENFVASSDFGAVAEVRNVWPVKIGEDAVFFSSADDARTERAQVVALTAGDEKRQRDDVRDECSLCYASDDGWASERSLSSEIFWDGTLLCTERTLDLLSSQMHM